MKKTVIVMIAILLLGVIVLAVVEFDSPKLGRYLLSRIGERAGMDLEAEILRINLLRGVTIGEIRGSSGDQERELELEIDSITLEHRLLPLLRGAWEFDRIVIERPRIVLRSESTGDLLGAAAIPAALAAPDEETTEARLIISSMEIRDGHVVVLSDGETGFEMEGLHLEIGNLEMEPAGLSGNGTIAADVISIGEMIIRNSNGPLSLQNGMLILNGHRFATDLGEFEAEVLEIDPAAEPFEYRLVLRGDPLDVADLLGGSGDGKAGTFLLEGTGRGAEKNGLRGAGRIHLPGGIVPPSPYLELIESFTGGLPIVGEPWEPADIEYQIAGGGVRLVPFTLVTRNAHLDVKGDIDLDGPLDLQLRIAAPRENIRVNEIPRDVLDLLTDDQGRVSIPVAMGGTIDDPRLRPDWDGLSAIGQSDAARKLIDRLDRNLRRLFD